MVNIKFLGNPFYCYALGFVTVLVVYQWQWSDLYPKIDIYVLGFLVSTILGALFLGNSFKGRFTYNEIPLNKNNFLYVLLIAFGYTLEFIYNKGIPLFMIFRGDEYSHYEFGIPTFHVFLQTVSPFYAVYLYNQYLSHKKKKLIIYLAILFTISVLLVNRGSTLMTLASCLIIYSQKKQYISYSMFLKLFLSLIFVFYMFGFIGFARSFKDHEDYFFDMAEATESFKTNIVPGEFFWFYLYASSPVANFQNAVNKDKNIGYNVFNFIGNELVPDFITKRIIDPKSDVDLIYNSEKYLIANFLTVGSTYYNPYVRMGWVGVIIIYLYLMALFTFLSFWVNTKEPYYSATIAILCTMALFSTFDNMIRFTGLSFQLVYPLLLVAFKRIHFKGKKIKFVLPKITLLKS